MIYDWIPLEFLNSQTCPHWASSSSSIKVDVFLPWQRFLGWWTSALGSCDSQYSLSLKVWGLWFCSLSSFLRIQEELLIFHSVLLFTCWDRVTIYKLPTWIGIRSSLPVSTPHCILSANTVVFFPLPRTIAWIPNSGCGDYFTFTDNSSWYLHNDDFCLCLEMYPKGIELSCVILFALRWLSWHSVPLLYRQLCLAASASDC